MELNLKNQRQTQDFVLTKTSKNNMLNSRKQDWPRQNKVKQMNHKFCTTEFVLQNYWTLQPKQFLNLSLHSTDKNQRKFAYKIKHKVLNIYAEGPQTSLKRILKQFLSVITCDENKSWIWKFTSTFSRSSCPIKNCSGFIKLPFAILTTQCELFRRKHLI